MCVAGLPDFLEKAVAHARIAGFDHTQNSQPAQVHQGTAGGTLLAIIVVVLLSVALLGGYLISAGAQRVTFEMNLTQICLRSDRTPFDVSSPALQ